MAKTASNLVLVKESQLKEIVKEGCSYLRLKFPKSGAYPIYLAYKERPTNEDLSSFVSLVAPLDEEYIIQWFEKTKKEKTS